MSFGSALAGIAASFVGCTVEEESKPDRIARPEHMSRWEFFWDYHVRARWYWWFEGWRESFHIYWYEWGMLIAMLCFMLAGFALVFAFSLK